jgi:pSer/pThr/pTyr-binding forkhead associated (FHA) protein
MWMLNTAEGTDSRFTFRILPGNIKTVGRAPRADFVVDAGMVSRIHCRISAGAAELEVQDLDSTNGTFVNGTRVARALLKEGDRLGVGRVELLISRVAGEGTGSSGARGRLSSVRRDPSTPASRQES